MMQVLNMSISYISVAYVIIILKTMTTARDVKECYAPLDESNHFQTHTTQMRFQETQEFADYYNLLPPVPPGQKAATFNLLSKGF